MKTGISSFLATFLTALTAVAASFVLALGLAEVSDATTQVEVAKLERVVATGRPASADGLVLASRETCSAQTLC